MGNEQSKDLHPVCPYCASEIKPLPSTTATTASASNNNNNNSNSTLHASTTNSVTDPNNHNNNNNNNNNNTDSEPTLPSYHALNHSHSLLERPQSLPSHLLFCPRCHGLIRKQSLPKKASFFSAFSPSQPQTEANDTDIDIRDHSNTNENNGNSKAKDSRNYLEYVYIVPFADTLTETEEKEMYADILIHNYIQPYFTECETQFSIRVGHRLIIKNIEFKILGCYPPRGFVNSATKFLMDDENGNLLKLHWRPIRRVHFLPTQASLDTYNKTHGITPDKKDTNNEALFTTHLKPYLKRTDAELYVQQEQQFVIVNGNNNSNNNNNSTHTEQESFFSSLATGSSNNHNHNHNSNANANNSNNNRNTNRDHNNNNNNNNNNHTSSKSLRRHLIMGDTFVYKEIQWRVMDCMPADGYIDAKTEVWCHGQPLADIATLQLRPIYEDLPNIHKNLSPFDLKSMYLVPHFCCSCHYIDNTRELKIFGVRFSVRESVPTAGIITCATVMDYSRNAAPIRASELQQMQEEEDMALARRLQAQENHRNPVPSTFRNTRQVTLADISDIFERLQQAQGVSVQHSSSSSMRSAAAAHNNGNAAANVGVGDNRDPFLHFVEQLRAHSSAAQNVNRDRGVETSLIDRLPTYIYKQSENNETAQPDVPLSMTKTTKKGNGNGNGNGNDDDDEEDDESSADSHPRRHNTESTATITCRICLETYVDGEELRLLPCFHKYHKDCIDQWFKMSGKCPICKTSIIQEIRR